MPRYYQLKVEVCTKRYCLERKKKHLPTREFKPTTSYTLVRHSTTSTACAVVYKGMLLKFSLYLDLLCAVENESRVNSLDDECLIISTDCVNLH